MTTDQHDSDEKTRISRRDLMLGGVAGGLALAAAGPLGGLLDLTETFAQEPNARIALNKLIAAAKKEGHLNVITLPRDWANYGQIMDRYSGRYGLGITDAIPTGSSAQEIQAIKSLKGQGRAPDVVDVSPAKAIEGKRAGLFVRYKVATWNTIPSNMKDPAGNWYGDYWGVVSFLSVNSIVKNPPRDWSDLLKPEYKGMVAIDGDPRQAGDAFAAVMAAALGNGGSLNNIAPGIDFFAKLKKAGNWNPTDALTANISKGATPISVKWDYLNLAVRDELKNSGQATNVNIPRTGVYGGYYCQAISRYAPHPMASRLWEEFLFSDEGQLLFLKGYTHPARYSDLARRGKIPAALARRLPPASAYRSVRFATPAQIDKAAAVLQAQWGPKMG